LRLSGGRITSNFISLHSLKWDFSIR